MKPTLSDRLLSYAPLIVKYFRSHREDGTCYPGHGLTAKVLSGGFFWSITGENLSDRDIRRIIQYARLNVPEGNRIAGTPDEGYFFCLNADEMRGTVAHLISEVATRNETIRKLKEAFTEQPELFPINSQAETEKSL